MPAELVLLLKTLAMNEGVGRQLDPGFNASMVAEPYVRAAIRRRLQPTAWEPEVRRGLLDLAQIGIELPGQVRRLTRRLDRGGLSIAVRADDLDEPLRRLEAMVNRLAMSILAAAFIVGVGLLMVTYHPGGNIEWVDWFFATGLAAVLTLGFLIVRSMRRSGRR